MQTEINISGNRVAIEHDGDWNGPARVCIDGCPPLVMPGEIARRLTTPPRSPERARAEVDAARRSPTQQQDDAIADRVVQKLQLVGGAGIGELVAQRVLEKLQAELATNITDMVLDRVAGACGLAMERALESGFASLQRRLNEAMETSIGRGVGRVEMVAARWLRGFAAKLEGDDDEPYSG